MLIRQRTRPVASTPFYGLEPHAAKVIYIDPPWRFILRSDKGTNKSGGGHYATMTLDQIKALPLLDIAARDCVLFMWGLPSMWFLYPAIFEAWGFQPKTKFTWLKTAKNGGLAFGTGYYGRNCHEDLYIGTIGSPRRKDTGRNVRDAFLSLRREHSRKPDEARDMIERLFPGPYVELFARQKTPGWSYFGNQPHMFSEKDTVADVIPPDWTESFFIYAGQSVSTGRWTGETCPL